mgnify:CR=1 FL=1
MRQKFNEAIAHRLAEHGIASVIETIGADEVNEAYDRVVRGDVRYRFVIDTATIGA